MALAEWANALVLLAAVIAGAVAVRRAIAHATAAQTALQWAIQNAELDRADRAAQDASTLDVYWGFDRTNPHDHEPFLLMLTNRGRQTLFDVQVWVRAGDVDHDFSARALPPGSWRARLKGRTEDGETAFRHIKPADPAMFSLADRHAYSVARYSFADARGSRWAWTEGRGLEPVA